MKIAILFVGRVYRFEYCYKTHFEKIFKENDVDVFLAHNSINDKDDLNMFKEIYDVKLARSFDIDLSKHTNKEFYKEYHTHGYNCLYMFTCLQKGYKMIKEYSNLNNIKYDLIIYMRADQIIKDDMEIFLPEKNTVYIPNESFDYFGINDQFVCCDLDTFQKYTLLIDFFEEYYNNDVKFNPEILLLHHLKHMKINIKRFKLDYELYKDRFYVNPNDKVGKFAYY